MKSPIREPQTIYRINKKPGAPADIFVIYKLDDDYRTIDQYTLARASASHIGCSCPAGHTWCRHKAMLNVFDHLGLIDSGWLFNWTTKQWIRPADPFSQGNSSDTFSSLGPRPHLNGSRPH